MQVMIPVFSLGLDDMYTQTCKSVVETVRKGADVMTENRSIILLRTEGRNIFGQKMSSPHPTSKFAGLLHNCARCH